jgi:hypothetical protein
MARIIRRFSRMVTRHMDKKGRRGRVPILDYLSAPEERIWTQKFCLGFYVVDDADGKAKMETTKSVAVRCYKYKY